MSPDEQLKLWVNGTSVHNGKTRSEGECCPDFSCCQPELLWPIEKRIEYQTANGEAREKMCIGSLCGLMDFNEIRKVHIIGKNK